MVNNTIAWSTEFRKKVIPPEQLPDFVGQIKKLGKSIATINGSFDLLHAGHLHMLHEASQQADVLIVALNSDNSIKQYKSPSRPIITLENRMQMMAAIGFVDFVTWFEETDPRHLLDLIKPHVHINGAEYGENCIESAVVKSNGGRIHIVQRVPELSTSAIIKKIQSEVAS